MARVEENEDAVPGSDNEEKKDSPEPERPKSTEPEDDAGEEEGGSDEEEEYEIEKIIDAKRGYFSQGQYGYLVKWKGYASNHNSWVSHEDAGNAQELIQTYWKEQKKKNTAKQAETKPKGTPASSSAKKRGRTSMSQDKSKSPVAAREPASTEKKRGRPAKGKGAKAAADESDEEPEEEDEEEKREKKKPRKSTENGTSKATGKVGKKAKGGLSSLDNDADGDAIMDNGDAEALAEASAAGGDEDEEVVKYGNMKIYMHLKSWEPLVEAVDTVERTDDNDLVVYFTINTGERMREKSALCARRFPQKLIKFYEGHLRWRGNGDAEV
ncbi:hypothetical protein BD410DRAFT_786707 [Rickenella mellea]|uniref:Chromo domain-containing protein n=1 Tax=Rickenella mellea TaxID=50990 RepID=A0A4Y7QAV8_9AGAM|nr:hypothetical protein BD410DRAFT_786707 [Rickenella mellea]